MHTPPNRLRTCQVLRSNRGGRGQTHTDSSPTPVVTRCPFIVEPRLRDDLMP